MDGGTGGMYARQLELSNVLSTQIRNVQGESKQLVHHLAKVKQQVKDATLESMSGNCTRIGPVRLQNHRTLRGHFNKVLTVSWHPDNRHLATAAQDGFLLFWDSTSGLKKNLIRLDDPYIICSDISPNGHMVATGGLENACIIYKLHSSPDSETSPKNSIVSIFKGHREYISDLSFVGNSQVLTSSGDKSIVLWDMEKGTRCNSFNGHLGDVLGLSVNPRDPNMFVSCSSDRFSNLWDVRSPLNRRQFQTSQTHDSSAVKFFPDGYSFACGTDDGEVKLFDIRSDCELSNYPVRQVHQHFRSYKPEEQVVEDSASSMKLSTKSSMVAALDNPGVLSIDFSKSGRLLFASYAEYSSVVVWDCVMGTIIGTLDGHRDSVSKIKISPDGLGIATASRDHTTRIWSV
ncbi:hypothetical protein OGAPHI_005467 [Ogataea philodendri]|uniref:Uncharacterized protein n=1 Tax=Ogataea philodendri TaxID=1378263 RepID=A0A9P8P042_9ASCO|nr:uncharacterized protein OGAPHI_005467 [Ogataea philodendri]KAH3662219.1 hypothetical protein OGAPHI_005467 [Ogataea philodendri]